MLPDLSKIITPADVSTKNAGGSYAADYINWAKVAHLLNTHANGWEFHLRPAADGGHVWRAPNGTGYVVGFFKSPEGMETADFPQAIMDNRNAPIVFDKISARELTDTHRRALCAAACFTFGLAYQLWAKEKVEDPFREPGQPPAKTITTAEAKAVRDFVKTNGITPQEAKSITGGKPADKICADDLDEVMNAFAAIVKNKEAIAVSDAQIKFTEVAS